MWLSPPLTTKPQGAVSSVGSRNEGRNLFIDLHGAGRLSDAKSVERALKSGLEKLGKISANVAVRRTADGTFSGAAMLESGQFSIRANPKSGYVAIDVLGCIGLDAHAAMFALGDAFGAREAAIQTARCSDAVFLPAVKPAAKARTKAEAKSDIKPGRSRAHGAKAEARAA